VSMFKFNDLRVRADTGTVINDFARSHGHSAHTGSDHGHPSDHGQVYGLNVHASDDP
jgi:hypothetical protein